MHTEYKALTADDFKSHLEGKIGIGGVPIMDDDRCHWAVIDIDNHGQTEDIPIGPVDDVVRALAAPLVICRSKSGGIHAYLFFEVTQSAARARALLTRWAALLGHPNAEIFPKQTRLAVNAKGEKQLGNWVNLPYMGNGSTNRYAVRAGKKLELEEFLTLAEKSRIGEEAVQTYLSMEHPEAPPCIQSIIASGAPQGTRNEALYNVVVYLRKLDPEKYEDRARIINDTAFSKPLPRAEASRTIASAARPDYHYRCNEEPIRSLCDRTTCLKRRHGISNADAERLQTSEALPEFSNLVKHLSEPVRWELTIDNVRVANIDTETLLDWKEMRRVIAERLTRVVPMIKNGEWERILQPLMGASRILEVPDEASVAGVIRDRLREFAAKTDLNSRGQSTEERRAMLRGLPVMVEYQGERCIAFRAQDFINYLKRTKSEELKGVNLWFAVKDIGVCHTKMRAGEANINVWYIPAQEVLRTEIVPPKPEFKADL